MASTMKEFLDKALDEKFEEPDDVPKDMENLLEKIAVAASDKGREVSVKYADKEILKLCKKSGTDEKTMRTWFEDVIDGLDDSIYSLF